MKKQKEIEHYLSCVLCNKLFNKTNKPLIMFCGHNICENCRLNNRKKVKCSTCGKIFSKREIKKFPINYSILSNKLKTISDEKDSQNDNNNTNNNSNEENVENLNISPETYMNFMSTLVNQVQKLIINNDNVKETKNPCDEIIKEREILVKDTFDLIGELENNFLNYLNIFFDSMTNIFKTNKEFLIDDLNICQLLQQSGIINYGDFMKLKKFLDIFMEIEENKLNNCKSFNDIFDLIKDKNNGISYEQFISLFFFFNKIYELKIKKLPKTLEEQKKLYTNDKENRSNLIHLLNNLAQKYEMKLSDIFYDITIYKTCHFIYDMNKDEKIKKSLNNFYTKNEILFTEYNNILIFYEPIKTSLNIQIIKIKELQTEEIIDSYLILNQLLYILTNKKIYIYELKTENYSSLNTTLNQEIEKNTKIFKYDTYIMKLSQNYFESINLRNEMSKNEWRALSLFENIPGKIKRPYPVCHCSDYIYVLDQEDKNINSIYLYNEESDSWDKKEIKLEIKPEDEEKDKKNKELNKDKDNEKEELIIVKKLYLEDYFFFNKCFACIFGGRHPVTKKFNKSVYMIDTVKGFIKKIIEFDEYINDDMEIINLNVGILNKYVDFIFIYHLKNDENNIKIKIIRKEIFENDISIETKLFVLIDINISDIQEKN